MIKSKKIIFLVVGVIALAMFMINLFQRITMKVEFFPVDKMTHYTEEDTLIEYYIVSVPLFSSDYILQEIQVFYANSAKNYGKDTIQLFFKEQRGLPRDYKPTQKEIDLYDGDRWNELGGDMHKFSPSPKKMPFARCNLYITRDIKSECYIID